MPDTLSTIHLMTGESLFVGRLTAAAAQEDVPGEGGPELWTWDHRYQLCAAPSWASKVDSWLAGNPGADPPNGWATDQAVISDVDITAQVQALLNPPG